MELGPPGSSALPRAARAQRCQGRTLGGEEGWGTDVLLALCCSSQLWPWGGQVQHRSQRDPSQLGILKALGIFQHRPPSGGGSEEEVASFCPPWVPGSLGWHQLLPMFLLERGFKVHNGKPRALHRVGWSSSLQPTGFLWAAGPGWEPGLGIHPALSAWGWWHGVLRIRPQL